MKKITLSILFTFLLVSMVQAKNPLLSNYNTLRGTIPFDEIEVNHYEPAFEEAIKMHDEEIRKIIENKEKPTFQNTIEALNIPANNCRKSVACFLTC